ncbi:acyltransferase domain-containing protein, partial [Streptomyces bungoensis]|uniref:acyltransferase domain-containing protein n=1 Tax=Streptomyces bungoensis TaxID=285568 RepID=UPI0034007C8F
MSHAFHSPLMEPMLADFRAVADGLSYERPTLPIVSTVTGASASADELMSPEYWVEHVRATVRFADAVAALDGQRVRRFLELGPDGTLTALARMTLDAVSRPDGDVQVFVPALRKERPEARSVLAALADVFVSGGEVGWASVIGDSVPEAVELPTYAFQHRRFWPAPAEPQASAGAGGEVDARFWEAVEREDLESLAGELQLEQEAVGAVLPALSSWRRQSLEQAELDGYRYRVHWTPVTDIPRDTSLPGRWLVIVPEDLGGDPLAASIQEVLAAAGAEVEWWTSDPSAKRADLAARLKGAGAVAGVVSLLALAREGAADDAVPQPVSACLGLVQALGDAGVVAPLWVVTRGAVSVGRS